MGYSWDKFLKPLSTTDKNIQIMDNDGVVKYTLNPYAILNVLVNNNLLKINLKSGKTISIQFSTTNESKLAITKIKELIDNLTEKVPNFLTKDVKNYVDDVILGVTFNIGNGLTLLDGTMSVGGTLYETLRLNGGSNDLVATGFDNMVFTSSVYDVVSDFISLDSNDSIQVLADYDVTVNASGRLSLSGDSGLISIGNTQGLVYNGDYFSGFVTHSLVDKNYVDNAILYGTSGTSGFSGIGNTSVWIVSESPEVVGNFLYSFIPSTQNPDTILIDINTIDEYGNDQTNMLEALSAYVLSGLSVVLSLTTGNGDNISFNVGTVSTPNVGRFLIESSSVINSVFLSGPTSSVVSYSVTGNSGTSGTSGVNGTDGTSGVNGTDGTSGVNGTDGTSGINGIDGAVSLRWSLENNIGTDPSGSGKFTVGYNANMISITLLKFAYNSLSVASEGFWNTIDNSILIGNSVYLQVTRANEQNYTALYKVTNVFQSGFTTPYEITVEAVYGNGQWWLDNEYSVSFSIAGANGTSGTNGDNGTSGTNGAQGAQGQSSNLFLYNTKTNSTSGNPTPTYISWSSTNQISSTNIFVSHLTNDNIDIDNFLSLIIKDQKIIIQDKNLSSNYQKWIVSGTPSLVIDTNNYWNIPVTLESSSGTGTTNIPNEHNIFLGLFSFNGTSGTSGLTPTTNWSLSGNLTVSGTSSLDGLTTLQEVSEVINTTPGASASTVVYDFSTGSIWYHQSANTNYTANFINVPIVDNRAITTTIIINQGATAYIPTSVKINNGSNETIKWSGGTASGSANKVDIIGFTFIRTSSSWVQVLGQINPFSS